MTSEWATAMRRRLGVMLALVVAASSSCSSGAGDPSSESSPFSYGPVPGGYGTVVAGRGTAEQKWGWDCCGTDEPYTVLSADGNPDDPDWVVVSTAGHSGLAGQGIEGQLAQTVYVHGGPLDAESFTLDGEPAMYQPRLSSEQAAQLERASGLHFPHAALVAIRGEDLVVRVVAPDRTREQLIEVLEAVEVTGDHRTAPTVAEPPDGLQVVGSVHADAVLALWPSVNGYDGSVPGPPSAHAVGWERTGSRGRDKLAALTLPGDVVDLDALRFSDVWWYWSGVWEPHTEGDASGWTMQGSDGHSERAAVWLESDWGDVVVVFAEGTTVPELDELARFATTLERSDVAEWDRLVERAIAG